ncbi:hemolysin [Enterococcus phoeniculicola]|jgi:CBS domain containing-hemolysin-like protein|uniref:Hemolysin n=1 Tax=Enterococcus phoeniculicola ATCC BAA-412 TaxID=1158610 RepID=R3TMF4_9ENTE|nr:hemolysin family protein [Enterococcus phoeniculicola]EOL42684.1 hemolysin [Enterococcus phoeniculicola ATCC BAA-412]EOT79032.1 hemolysin [Enterococcus phoeniculicola ATCC BAA-412]OJG72425.1 hemolysin [Enterococcus phoeniculicola]
MWINFVILILMIAITALFVASEFALVKIRPSRLEQLKNDGVKNADLALKVTHHLDAYLSASQLGITLTGLIIGWVGEGSVAAVLEPLIGGLPLSGALTKTISVALGFIIVTYVDVVVGELLPKSYSIVYTEKVVLAIVKPLHYFYTAMFPFIWLLNHSAAGLGKLLGVQLATEGEETLSQEELTLVAMNSYQKGEITKEEYHYLENVFEFDDTLAKDIQVDRTSMAVFEADDTVQQAIKESLEQGHTRYPVIEESKDNVLGYVTLPALIRQSYENDQVPVGSLVEEVIVVAENMPIKKVLTVMRKERKHLAILKDEYGGTSGLVTIEDILEELVGDIRDETDVDRSLIVKQIDGSYIVSGKISLDDFQRYFHVHVDEFDSSEFTTLAGYMLDFDKTITSGSQLTIGAFQFTVLDFEPAHINFFKVTLRKETQETDV